MSTTITRKITAALAGVAATAGVFAGIALAAPAQAKAPPTAAANCTTSFTPSRMNASSTNPLTRAAQVNAVEKASTTQGPSVSCVGH